MRASSSKSVRRRRTSPHVAARRTIRNPTPDAVDITWSQDASNRRASIGQRFTYRCSPNGAVDTVWGTDVYTDDSSICNAAVHAGKITRAAGGTVTIEMRPAQAAYVGSARNGVTSNNYGSWGGSFILK